MDYVPKVGDWILYLSRYGVKIGVVRYIKKASATQEVDACYTDDDRVYVSEILEIRT